MGSVNTMLERVLYEVEFSAHQFESRIECATIQYLGVAKSEKCLSVSEVFRSSNEKED